MTGTMKAHVLRLQIDLANDVHAANGASDEAGVQESALDDIVMDSASGESLAYASMRDYISRVRHPAISLQRDFLLAYVGDLYSDQGQVAEKLSPLGPVVDTDGVTQSIGERQLWADGCYDRARDIRAWSPVVSDALCLVGDMLRGQADGLQRRLDAAMEYFSDNGIYADSISYVDALRRQQETLSSVRRNPITGAIDIAGLDLSWVVRHDEEWQRRRNRATLERYFTLDANGDITGVRLGMQGRVDELLDIAWKSLTEGGASEEIARLTPDERYALLYALIKVSPKIDELEHAALQASLQELAGMTSLSDLESRIVDISNAIGGADIPLVTSWLSFTTDGGIFYSKDVDGSVQKRNGFGDWIEFAGPALGMDLDTHITTFVYDGKEYRIQSWDGTYGAGLFYGGEIAVYTRDAPTLPSEQHMDMSPQDIIDNLETLTPQQTRSIFITYEPATGSDAPDMHIHVNTGGKRSIRRSAGKGYWTFDSKFVPRNPTNGYPKPGYTQEDISVTGTVSFEDEGLRDAARAALERDGVDVREQGDGSLVIGWDK